MTVPHVGLQGAESLVPRPSSRKGILPYHCETSLEVNALADSVFAYLDDHTRLSAHMNRRSWMMGGSRMVLELDASGGRTVGARIRLSGRIAGIRLSVEEVVTDRHPPLRKVWETIALPRLLVIGQYRMGFDITPKSASSTLLCVFIDYALPQALPARWCGYLFGNFYARWCTRRMVGDAAKHFNHGKKDPLLP